MPKHSMASAEYPSIAEQQKSILSQLTLDTSLVSQNPLIPPIHAGQLSYPIYKLSRVQKTSSHPLPFGSNSCRLTAYLSPTPSSHVLSYIPLYPSQKEDQDIFYRAPFGTSEPRFAIKTKGAPGPATYNVQSELYFKKTINTVFPLVGKQVSDKPSEIGPGSYHLQEIEKKEDIRERVKQKLRQNKEKYTLKRQKSQPLQMMTDFRKDQQENTPLTLKDSINEKQSGKGVDRFLLKESAQKYLRYPASPPSNASTQPAYSHNKNFSPVFIEHKDNPLNSYIPISNSPGPAWYLRKPRSLLKGSIASCSFNSKVDRDVFPAEEVAKGKIKLSYLL